MTTQRIRKIGILSAGFTGIAFSLIPMFWSLMVFTVFSFDSSMFNFLLESPGYIAVLVFIYPIIGFITGVILAITYNLTARVYGGLKIDFK